MESAADETWLLGLDIGSTTTQAIASSARILRNCVTGRMELSQANVVYRSPVVFTPFRGDKSLSETCLQRGGQAHFAPTSPQKEPVPDGSWTGDELDDGELDGMIESWITAAGIELAALFAGGAILTGLAAQARNAAAVARLLRSRFPQSMVVTADDPRLESWLAFLGSCTALSKLHTDVPIINLDIGGGTTNPAWGLAGEVRQVGCYVIGARHVRLTPGTWRIEGLSALAVRLFESLGIRARLGDELAPDDRDHLLDFYVATLEAIVCGDRVHLAQEPVRWHEQAAFEPPKATPIITLSGGVGELAYACARGETLPSTTAFGDLGIDLARCICQSPLLAKDLRAHAPANRGAATVCGLALHTAELSGTTLYLPRPDLLPLADLPILGCLCEPDSGRLEELLDLAKTGGHGAAIRIDSPLDGWQSVKRMGEAIALAITRRAYPPERPLVLLVGPNIGKTLGQYATQWGKLPANLIVIDELPPRPARFVRLGALRHNVVPVSYYGLMPHARQM
jgi:ethanolamine utilization protein EutA